jgi:NAD(P)-dependent dehydrogenase (short-subunit alcohol dehydrogenase family)
MLLENKNAVIYGGSGSVGGAVARAFAREGARVFLAGRTLATLDAVAEEVRSSGGAAETAQVDALDERAVEEHADAVAREAGGIDVSFNAIANDDVQGAPLAEMPFEHFSRPIAKAMRNQFLTSKAVARHMVERGSGVIMTITGGYREAFPNIGGTIVTWAAMEAQCRQWASELGLQGVRVVWLRTTGLPETIPDTGDAVSDLGTGYGEGVTREEIIAEMRDETILKRLASLDELGKVAAFMASDQASPMTATFANITCGAVLD